MEESTELEVTPEENSDAVVLELQAIQLQNEALISEVQALRLRNEGLHADVLLLVLFVAVIMVYKIRDVFLSFVKKGGIKRDV